MSDSVVSATDSIPTDLPTAEGAIEQLRSAAAKREAIEDEIESHGEDVVETAADAYRSATRLLDSYEDTATGTGDFASYLEFQNQFLALVSSLPETVPARDGFEEASDRMDKRRLSAADFAFARGAIEPAGEFVELLRARDEARSAYNEARRDARERLSVLREAKEAYAELVELTALDLTVPVEALREPIDAYNEAVTDAFESFKTNRGARELFTFVESTKPFPFVAFQQPPPELLEYIRSADAGDRPLTELLDLVDYSASKLDHYVDDPGALRTNVAVHRTYLDRLSADPLRISWPPEEAGILQFRLNELTPVTRKLDAEAIEPHLRTLRRVVREDDYETLKNAATARAELDEETFDRIVSGAIEADYEAVVDSIERLETALEETALED
ncbi:DUF7118 family protein [Halalkalirubrum salinum]|uniref:DUF7118 family protein n=1 Tax=Halalkalirubrum salinum TaxID=2563889 RepID=UPI0010FB4327|nr:hypothetical protein [Halalkalirubrum salinum]